MEVFTVASHCSPIRVPSRKGRSDDCEVSVFCASEVATAPLRWRTIVTGPTGGDADKALWAVPPLMQLASVRRAEQVLRHVL